MTASLFVDPISPRFTREELVREMCERFGFSDGAFRRYQELGLIGAPHRNWTPGRKGSDPGLWSDNDRKMLAAVLELRSRHATEVGGQFQLSGLGNFIVWSWAFWDGYVELEQARRALRTWVTPQLGGAGPGRARSRSSMRKLARLTVDQIAAPGVPLKERKRVTELLTNHLWEGDREGLRSRVEEMNRIVDPNNCGRRIGAPGASVDAAGELERLYLSHLGAEAVVTGAPEIAPEQWEHARQLMRHAWTSYVVEQPRLVAQATTPAMFDEPTMGHQVRRASASLLLILGAQIDDATDSGSVS